MNGEGGGDAPVSSDPPPSPSDCPPFCSADGQPHGPSGPSGSNRNADGTEGGGSVGPTTGGTHHKGNGNSWAPHWVQSAAHSVSNSFHNTASETADLFNPDIVIGTTEIVGSLYLTTVGASGIEAGVGLCATGIGCFGGGPLVAVSATGIVVGAYGSIDGAKRLGEGIHQAFSKADGQGGGGSDPLSNRVRPPREGDRDYQVDDPNDPSDTITDIDRIEDGVLWEEKTATGRDSRINATAWTQKHVIKKLNSYVRARSYMEGYEDAPIGVDFTAPGATPEFRNAVESTVSDWRASNPGISVTVRWAD